VAFHLHGGRRVRCALEREKLLSFVSVDVGMGLQRDGTETSMEHARARLIGWRASLSLWNNERPPVQAISWPSKAKASNADNFKAAQLIHHLDLTPQQISAWY